MAVNPMNMNNVIMPNQMMTPGGQMMYGPGYENMPVMPGYRSSYDPLTMNMTPEIEKRLAGIDLGNLNKGVDAFREMAMRKGPSSWSLLANQQQDQLMNQLRERAVDEGAGATAGALDRIAQTGGLTSGARERAIEGGAKARIASSQDAGRQNALNKLQIGVNDQQNKIQQLGMLPGIEQQALAPQFQKQSIWQNAADQNINRVIAANQEANRFNENKYNKQMDAWAADKQATATENAGKK